MGAREDAAELSEALRRIAGFRTDWPEHMLDAAAADVCDRLGWSRKRYDAARALMRHVQHEPASLASPAASGITQHVPLHVRAYVSQQLVLRSGTIALDAVLEWIIWNRGSSKPVSSSGRGQRHPELHEVVLFQDQIALCSHAKPEMFEMERRYVNRRMPINLARHLCDDVRRINMSVGAEKSYHIPYSTGFLKDGFVEWWLLGNPVHVASLLFKTRHIGARRGAGYGRVDRWEIAECSTWDGFPVVRDGKPLRALPHDWPGVFDAAPTFATLTAPYWDLTKEEPAWVGT